MSEWLQATTDLAELPILARCRDRVHRCIGRRDWEAAEAAVREAQEELGELGRLDPLSPVSAIVGGAVGAHLLAAGIRTVADLTRCTFGELTRSTSLRRTVLMGIQQRLEQHGLSLRQPTNEKESDK